MGVMKAFSVFTCAAFVVCVPVIALLLLLLFTVADGAWVQGKLLPVQRYCEYGLPLVRDAVVAVVTVDAIDGAAVCGGGGT